MCIIIDSSMFGRYLDPENKDFQPLRNWLSGNSGGKIVYPEQGRYRQELESCSKMKNQLLTLMRANRAKRIPTESIKESEQYLQTMDLQSNDIHILALAHAGNIKLMTSADELLIKDFKNKNLINGKIYKSKDHKHLLTRYQCP